MASFDQLASNAGDGQALPPSALYADYVTTVAFLAPKIENTLPSNVDVINTLAVTFEDLYQRQNGDSKGLEESDNQSHDTTKATVDSGSSRRDGCTAFPDKRTEQIYNRAAEDAALAVMSKSITSDQKAQAVLTAMNKAGVHNSVDLDNFDTVLSKKLGKNAQVEGVRTQALFASQFRGVLKIDTGRGETLDVPFNTNIKGDLICPTRH